MVRDIVLDFTNGKGVARSTLVNSTLVGDTFSSFKPSLPPIPVDSIFSPTNKNEFGQTFLQANGIVASLPPISKLDQVIVANDPFLIASNIQNIV